MESDVCVSEWEGGSECVSHGIPQGPSNRSTVLDTQCKRTQLHLLSPGLELIMSISRVCTLEEARGVLRFVQRAGRGGAVADEGEGSLLSVSALSTAPRSSGFVGLLSVRLNVLVKMASHLMRQATGPACPLN